MKKAQSGASNSADFSPDENPGNTTGDCRDCGKSQRLVQDHCSEIEEKSLLIIGKRSGGKFKQKTRIKMPRTNFQELLDAGVHFGHLARKWNPKMAPYIFDQKNGIHIIDLHKTIVKIDEAADAMKELARSGRKILFVATKKQAKEIVAEKATAVNMPSITERWAGGMLTNFPTIRKAIKKMNTIDKMKEDGTFEKLAKRERLQIDRQREKLEKNLGGIKDMKRIPDAIFVVDPKKERICIKEAQALGITLIGIADTNCDPDELDYVIPGNDDAIRAVKLIVSKMADAVIEAKQGAEEEVTAEEASDETVEE